MVKGTDTLVDSQIGGKQLFSVGDAVYTWNDVVERARATGVWEALEQDVRGGIAALQEASPDEEDVDAAARAFRYARGLLAGDELDAWLDARGLTRESWDDYLRRSLARESASAEPPASPVDAPAVWVEGMCSGTFDAIAHELASLAAVAPAVPPERLDAEFAAFCRAAATDAAIANEVESNRLHWIRVGYDAAVFADEDVASEVALCVRTDGEPLADVAARVGAELEEWTDWLDEVQPELASRFFAAEEGDLVGPLASGDGFLLAHVRTRTPPDAGDEDVRDRAAAAIAERAVTRCVTERVTWLEPL